MKYLNYRNDFLYEKKNFNKDLESSTLIREYLENVTRFGDTLVGRLFNSTWQLGRWAVKAYQIRTILQELEANLQNLIDRIDMVQITKEFPTLCLKMQLERIKTVCISTLTEPQKLEQLIGWDGATLMYDTNNPIADIPGIYDGQTRRILIQPTPLAQEVYDNINEPLMRERLEEVNGEQLVKSFLDSLSNFMDECRKLTVPVGAAKPDFSTNIYSFNSELQEILARVVRDVKELANEGRSHMRIARYFTFLNEDVEQTSGSVEELEKVAKSLQDLIESNPDEDVRQSKEYKQLFDILNKLSAEHKDKIDSDIKDLEKLTGKEIGESPKQQPKEKTVEPKEVPTTTEAPKQTVTDKQPTVQKPTPSAPPQKEQPQIKKDGGETKAEVKPTTVEKPQPVPTKEPEVTKPSTTTPPTKEQPVPQNKTTPPTPQSKTPEPQAKTPVTEKPVQAKTEEEKTEETEIKESVYSSYISLILEEAPKLFPEVKTASFGPGGTSQTPTEVKEIWNYLFEEVDKILPAEMTQEEVETLSNYTPPRVDAAFDFVQQPDPLIRIVRIFERANAIYTQPMIPSGRMNGEVDSEVYRRFIFVGTGSPGTRDRPGYGPWVQKYQFRQWTNGVYEMMASNRFRDVFKNIQNIIPESFETGKIYEAETDTKPGEVKKTPFEIIKEFMLDMLNIKNQGDFAKYESEAMKRYFGINIKPQQLVSDKPANLEKPKMDPSSIQSDSFIWEGTPQTSFTDGDRHHLFAFPINHNNRNRMLFIEPISLQPNGLVEVKFTFDHQTVVTQERQQTKYSTAPTIINIYDWSCNTQTRESTRTVYYGLMVNDFRTQFTMCWVPCQNSSRNNPALPPIEHGRIQRRPAGNTQMNNGQSLATFPSKLTYFDSQKQKSYPQISNTQVKVNYEVDTDRLKDWQNSLMELRTSGGPTGHQYWS